MYIVFEAAETGIKHARELFNDVMVKVSEQDKYIVDDSNEPLVSMVEELTDIGVLIETIENGDTVVSAGYKFNSYYEQLVLGV